MAMNFMSEEELSAFNHIGYIVLPKDLKQYLNGAVAPSEAAQFQKSFWNNKDPLYLTSFNERLLEHYNRMTYANLRFGVPRMNIAGWKTDRGMIYIRYGKPVLSYKTQPDEKKLGGAEIWAYPEFSFTFDDEYASGQFLMDQKSFIASRSAYNTQEEMYALPREKTFEMQSRLYQFKGSQGSTRAKAYFQTYIQGIEPEFAVLAMDVEAECGLFFLDSRANIVHESRKRLRLGRQDTTEQSFVSYIELNQLPTQASAQRYSFEIMTLGDRRSAVSRDSTRIVDYSGDRLMLSDVIVASRITEDQEIKIIPNFAGIFSRSDNLYLYFEVYNLLLNNESRGRYKVSTRIQPRGRSGIAAVIENLLNEKKQGQIGSSFEVTSYARDERYYFGLNLSDIPAGTYDLYLQITDMIARESIERVLPITINE
ncbi:GWxTD domain-containing protein [bacterium]|nr:GWxTD domain-containing protein [bacterium]